MSTSLIDYPETDGEPMAENTLQWEWIVTIKEGFETVFRDRDDVFVAGDLFWYPIEGDNRTRLAPDVMVAIGRPKGRRGSYRQWDEADVPPQVVVEVLSPSNRAGEMTAKRDFYERHGVEEYYIYDPDNPRLDVWVREGNRLRQASGVSGWRSPRLDVLFELADDGLRLFGPDGRRFLTYQERVAFQEAAERQKEAAERQKEAAERQKEAAEHERDVAREQRRLTERQLEERDRELRAARLRLERLAEFLRAAGLDPETGPPIEP